MDFIYEYKGTNHIRILIKSFKKAGDFLHSSTMGKALCKDLLPSSDYEEILSAQTETKDALTRLYKTGYLSFQGTFRYPSTFKIIRN